MTGPLDGWDECQHPGRPSWDDNTAPDDVEAFEDSDGWAHGTLHVHHIDHYLIETRHTGRAASRR